MQDCSNPYNTHVAGSDCPKRGLISGDSSTNFNPLLQALSFASVL